MDLSSAPSEGEPANKLRKHSGKRGRGRSLPALLLVVLPRVVVALAWMVARDVGRRGNMTTTIAWFVFTALGCADFVCAKLDEIGLLSFFAKAISIDFS